MVGTAVICKLRKMLLTKMQNAKKKSYKKLVCFFLGPLACIAGVKWGRGGGGVETEEEGDVGGRGRDGT